MATGRATEWRRLQRLMSFPLTLAPMVGLSHAALRMVLREYLPAGQTTIWPTEMLNSRRLPVQRVGQTPETLKGERETQLVPQILGHQEEFIARSVQKLEAWGAVGIDINMGCPVRKALKHNYGVALMGDAQYAADVVAMTVRSTRLPVSVKLRAGLQNDLNYLREFALGLQQAGAAWISLHPRTAGQQRRGRADWSQIAHLKETLQVPVIGNGDVQTWQDALRLQRESGCDGVMVGRALTARPWLLWQVGAHLGLENPCGKDGEPPFSPEQEAREFGHCFQRQIDFHRQFFALDLGLRKFKFYLKNAAPWLEFGHLLTARASRCQTWPQLETLGREFFARPQRMLEHTQLRY